MRKINLIFILILGLINASGQTKVEDSTRLVTETTDCDTTVSELHTVFTEFNQNALEKSFLLIIGKSAKGEKQFHNSKRISAIVKYMREQGVEESKIIFAKAQSTDKYGYVEVYINGRLQLLMRARSNRNFCTYCCEAL